MPASKKGVRRNRCRTINLSIALRRTYFYSLFKLASLIVERLSKTITDNTTMPSAEKNTHVEHKSFADFAGKWRITREIKDHSGGTTTFYGEANLSGCDDQMRYSESGQVTLSNNRTIQAERTYLWRKGSDGQIDVYFDDGRFFHRFSAGKPYAEHLCGDDHYKVIYDFTQWPVWYSTWRVNGPRKDYTMVSCYSPL